MRRILIIILTAIAAYPFNYVIPQQKDTSKTVESIYDEGFWSIGKDDKLRIFAWTQEDYRLYDAKFPSDNTFLNRRTRIGVLGTLENIFNYQVMAAFERSSDPVQFAWVEYAQLPFFKFRAGQFKEPYSREELTPDLYLDILERSIMTSNLSPAQDLGIMIHGKLGSDIIEYGLGAFNGRGKNKIDNTDDKDVAGRIDLNPFNTTGNDFLKGLYIGGAFTTGHQEESFKGVSYKTAGQTNFWTFNDSVKIDDKRTRVEADFEWLWGPVNVKAEWSMNKFNNVTKGSLKENIEFNGWFVSAAVLLTGEAKTRNKPVVPKNEFDPLKGNWGAVELALRYEQFEAKNNPILRGFAVGTDKVNSLSAGLNWTPNKHVRLSADYIRTKFNNELMIEGDKFDSENLFLFRFQFEI